MKRRRHRTVEEIEVKRSEDLTNGWVCSSWRGIQAESTNKEDAIQFVKGSIVCGLGQFLKDIPDELVVVFKVKET